MIGDYRAGVVILPPPAPGTPPYYEREKIINSMLKYVEHYPAALLIERDGLPAYLVGVWEKEDAD